MRGAKGLKKRILSLIICAAIMLSTAFASLGAGLLDSLEQYNVSVISIPSSHPRLLFTEKDIPGIIENAHNTKNKKAMAAFNAAIAANTMNVLNPEDNDNANSDLLFKIQAKAFNYAVFNGDTGRDAVESMIDYFEKYNYPEQDYETLTSYHRVTYAMYSGALVYDWCFDIMDDESKKKLESQLLQLAEFENNFVSLTAGLNPFGGTGTSNYIMRDFLSLGVALYDDYPEIFNYISDKLINTYKPIEEFFMESKSSFFGYQYGAFALYGETMALRIMDALGYHKLFNDGFFEYLDYYMASRLPDGTALVEGDDYLSPKGNYERSIDDCALAMVSAAGAYYTNNIKYKNYFKELTADYTKFWYNHISLTPIDYFLLVKASDSLTGYEIPKNIYFPSPMGAVISRVGGEDKAVVRMKIGEAYRWHHQHFDAGSFEIYYKGKLTGQSAQYSRTDIDQYSNYYVQSVASNTLLIKDPNEHFRYWNSFDLTAENTGGQRVKSVNAHSIEEWKNNESLTTGKIKAHKETDSYSYISGDITDAYSDKVSEVSRSMLLLDKKEEKKAGILFIMDKITSADAAFKKSFLLHCMSEPVVENNKVIFSRTDNGYNGRLTLINVYPKNSIISPIGGEGKQWLVNGTNYSPLPSYAPALSEDYSAYGWGRVEVSPAEPANTDYLLNIIYIDDADNDTSYEVKGIENELLIGAATDGEVVVFAKNSEREKQSLSFSLDSASQVKVANIAEGWWNVYINNLLCDTLYATEESGMISFDADAGEIRLEYAYDDLFSGGYGTESVPYIIKTAEDFKNIAFMDNEDVFYKQACDINLGSYTPFEFCGNYDGNNKVLNISINGTDDSGTGLFSVLSKSASLKNIIVDGSVNGTNYVGGIAGKISDAENIIIKNCINKADVSGSGVRIGGIIGDLYMDNKLTDSMITLDRLENNGNISGNYWVAGIAGVCKVTLKNMKNTGTVTGTGSTGGIAGLTYSVITDSANCGEISGSPAGGISGHIIIGTVKNSFNSGNILKNKYKVTGGIVGLSDRGDVSYCYDAGYLHNAETAIIGQINDSKDTTSVKYCFYLNPENKKGISGSYPMTDSQLRSLSINSSYQKTTTAYPYPQLKNISPLTEAAELYEAEVNGEMCDIYPSKGRIYIRENSDITFTVYPYKYYTIKNVYLNDAQKELSDQSITVSGIKSNLVFEVLCEAVSPVIGKTLVFNKAAQAGDFLPVIDGYINFKDDFYCLIYSNAEGIFSDCGFSISEDGENYKDYTAYKPDVTEHAFGVYFHSKKPGKYYIKPYVKDNQGRVYYGQQTEVQLMSLEK